MKLRKGIKILHTWEAPERIWEPKTRVWYLSSAAVALILILIAVKLGYLILIIGIVAILFLWFVQGSTPPWVVTHKITSQGIYTFNTLFRWETISFFWFANRKDHSLLYLDFPKTARQPRLTLLVSKGDEQEIFDTLVTHIKYADPQEAEYNVLAHIIYGEYLPLSNFVPDLDEPGPVKHTKTAE